MVVLIHNTTKNVILDPNPQNEIVDSWRSSVTICVGLPWKNARRKPAAVIDSLDILAALRLR